jgi:hypothetical protein
VKIREIKFESVEPFFKKVNTCCKTLAAAAQMISFSAMKNFFKNSKFKEFSLKN